MLSVICWKWTPKQRYRSTFGPDTVNVLRRMVARNYPKPHVFKCVTNETRGLDTGIEIIEDRQDFATVQSPHGAHNPSCYRRLRMFAPDAGRWFGQRFVSLDLDTVIVGDLTPLWDRPEDFVAWGEVNPKSFYNGSMMLMTAGARPQVWQDFDPKTSPAKAKAAGKFGSDQGWLSYCLGPGEATWTQKDGVYSYNVHLRNKASNSVKPLPPDARIVMFHGGTDPWAPAAKSLPFVREHYQ